jgi:DNA repair exonuclease SbcCD ATPase subunit
MRLAEKDRRDAVSTRKVREQDVLTLTTELAGYDGLDDAVAQVREVEDGYKTVEQAGEKLRQLGVYQETLRDKAAAARALKAATAPSLPDHDALVGAQEKLVLLDDFRQRSERLSDAVELLSSATEPTLPDHEALEASLKRAAETRAFGERFKTVRREIKALESAQEAEVPDNEPIETAFKKTQQLGIWVKRLQEFKRVLSGAKEVRQPLSDPESLSVALGRFQKMAQMQDRKERLEAAIATLAEKLEVASREERELEQEFQELGACPTCSQRLEPGHMLGHD